MKKYLLATLALTAAFSGGVALVACGGDDTSPVTGNDAGKDVTTADSPATTDTGTDSPVVTDTGTDTNPPGPPAPPTLGAQLDRFGRPAINTALNHTFDPDTSDGGTKGTAKDKYNTDKAAAGWVAAYQPQFAGNLAIYDSLDSVCGNQPYAQADGGADRYKTLSSVLAGDKLWVNTGSTTCTTYLAVELNATGVVVNTDCGGRKLAYDVIDTTYSVVSGVGLSGFGDTIGPNATKTGGATFPYLSDPQ